MEFILKDLFIEQEKLDSDIHSRHNVNYETTKRKRSLSFLVELGELANATRCFKFWSLKPSESKERIIDEFADGLHFILSLGIAYDFKFDSISVDPYEGELSEGLLEIYEGFADFLKNPNKVSYIKSFYKFLSIVPLLGATEQEIIDGYYKKLEVNYSRQENHY